MSETVTTVIITEMCWMCSTFDVTDVTLFEFVFLCKFYRSCSIVTVKMIFDNASANILLCTELQITVNPKYYNTNDNDFPSFSYRSVFINKTLTLERTRLSISNKFIRSLDICYVTPLPFSGAVYTESSGNCLP